MSTRVEIVYVSTDADAVAVWLHSFMEGVQYDLIDDLKAYWTEHAMVIGLFRHCLEHNNEGAAKEMFPSCFTQDAKCVQMVGELFGSRLKCDIQGPNARYFQHCGELNDYYRIGDGDDVMHSMIYLEHSKQWYWINLNWRGWEKEGWSQEFISRFGYPLSKWPEKGSNEYKWMRLCSEAHCKYTTMENWVAQGCPE